MQAPPLLRGADNKDPHVMLGSRLDGTPIRSIHEIPVEVHIVEGIGGNDLLDQIARSVRRESKEGGPPLMDDLPRGFEGTTGADCLLPALPVIDSVNGEKINMSQLQVAHRLIESRAKVSGGGGSDLGLDDHLPAGEKGEDFSKLNLRSAVATSGLDMVNAGGERLADALLEVGLSLGRDPVGILVVPTVLVAHPPAGENGHLEARLTKSSSNHGVS